MEGGVVQLLVLLLPKENVVLQSSVQDPGLLGYVCHRALREEGRG